MAFDDAVASDPVPTTRRAVLGTGVKLAYAVPMVAASMKLAEQAGGAVSGSTCEPPGGPCTIDNFIQVCCHGPGGVGCQFPTGDPQNGFCFTV